MTQLVYSDLRTNGLAHGPLHWFRDWPDASVPMFGAGVYTIWDTEQRFNYVGMSGRSIKPGMEIPNRRHGIVTRLHSHASGRRSGDQFCVYVADRFVLSTLSSEDKGSHRAVIRSTPTSAGISIGTWAIGS